MWDSEELSCCDCHMVFRSGGLLDKHKARFCLGSDIGDPGLLRRGRVEFAKPERSTWRGPGPCRTNTPDLISLRDMRVERMRQSQVVREGGDTQREEDPKGSMSDSIGLRRLTNEFVKLRMSIQESMSSLPQQQMSESVSAVPEASQVAHGERLREMSEQHHQQLVEIRAHTDHLLQQKEEIEQRLASLAGVSSTAHLESLLQELREQEERNEEALQHLRTQISILHSQQGAKEADAPPDSPEDKRTQHVTFDLISSVDGPLSNQIRALRLAYMQSGGSEPEILAQMHDLQAEAHMLEQSHVKQNHKNCKKRVKARPQAVESELISLELDNRQLEEQIFQIHLLRQRQHDQKGAEFQLMQRQQLQQLADLRGEMESLCREVDKTRAQRQAPPPPPPPFFPGVAGSQFQASTSLGQRKAQTSLLSRRLLDPRDALGPAPYDPVAGFVVFYDMLVGVDATLTSLRLVVGLFSLGQELGRPTPLPLVQCQPTGALPYPYSLPTGNYGILSAKQPMPRIQPSPTLALLVEVQAVGGLDPSGQEIQELVSRGWTRLQLFDQHNQVLSGYWRLPFRVLPVKPTLSSGQLNSVPQLSNMELCLRVANARDGELQSLNKIDPSDTTHYKYPAVASGAYGESLHPTVLQPSSNPAPSALSVDQVDPLTVGEFSQSHVDSVREGEGEMEGFGVLIDRVKGAPSGQGSLRLTGYSLKSGQVIMCGMSAVHCSTSTVSSSILHGHFIYGEQQAYFNPVQPKEDMVLILRFYHLPADGAVLHRSLLRQQDVPPWESGILAGNLTKHEECVVAWGAIRLTSQGSHGDESQILWNAGTHLVPLYCTPVPPVVSLIPLPGDCLMKPFKPFDAAKIQLHIYSGQPPPFPFPSEFPVACTSPSTPTLSSQEGFVLCERVNPPVQPFCQGDVVIIHIDGARFLPDCSTISRVMGGVFDHNYNQVGPDIATSIDLDSNIYEPFYNYRLELRCPKLPSSSTILLKVYTVDRFSLKTVIIGWSALGLFVKSGSETQASIDTSPQQVCLNEGAHQLRLYHQCPAAGTPLSSQALASSNRMVPCATVLMRVSRSPAGPTESQGPQQQQLTPRPKYSDKVYYSSSARPTSGETRLLAAMMNRLSVTVRETSRFITGDSWGPDPKSDMEIGDYILQKLSHASYIWPQSFNLNLVSHYASAEGFKVSVVKAVNLPWSAFPMGICTLCPPAAAYQGSPWHAYELPMFIQCLDLKSSQSAPQWLDGYMSFHERVYHQYMTAIIHLYAVSVIPNEASEHMHDGNDGQGMGLGLKLEQQCWVAVPIFTHGYCNTEYYQLPLLSGAPSQKVLWALRKGKCKHILNELLQNNEVELLPGASVFVKVADGRRHQELGKLVEKDAQRSLFHFLRAEDPQKMRPTPSLRQLIPERFQSQPGIFSRLLAKHFRQESVIFGGASRPGIPFTTEGYPQANLFSHITIASFTWTIKQHLVEIKPPNFTAVDPTFFSMLQTTMGPWK